LKRLSIFETGRNQNVLRAELEQRVRERTRDLEAKIKEVERINKLFVGRELDMIELKKRIKELEGRLTRLH